MKEEKINSQHINNNVRYCNLTCYIYLPKPYLNLNFTFYFVDILTKHICNKRE